jgi:hypothetical protein
MRCYLFRYSVGPEVVRWFHDDGCAWIQQVFKLTLDTGKLEYTGDDPNALIYKDGLPQLIEGGQVEELA